MMKNFSVRQIDNLSDDAIKSLAGLKTMSKRQIDILEIILKQSYGYVFR